MVPRLAVASVRLMCGWSFIREWHVKWANSEQDLTFEEFANNFNAVP